MDRFCQRNNVTTVQDAVTKLYKCVVEIKMKAHVEDGCGPSMSVGSRGLGSKERSIAPYFTPLVHICFKGLV